MDIYFFVFLAVLAIASALALVISKSTVNSALFLVLNMVSLAGIFLLLQAQFLALIQILVYAGAIMVLFLFVIMLLNLEDEASLFDKLRIKYLVSFLLGVVVLSLVVYSLGSYAGIFQEIAPEMAYAGTVEALGAVLYTDYLFAFEMTAILLTAAVVGALMIAQFKAKNKEEIQE